MPISHAAPAAAAALDNRRASMGNNGGAVSRWAGTWMGRRPSTPAYAYSHVRTQSTATTVASTRQDGTVTDDDEVDLDDRSSRGRRSHEVH